MGSRTLKEQMVYEPIIGRWLPWDCISRRRSTALWIRPLCQMTSGGTKRYETIGHVTFTKLEGSMFITGKFKQDSAGKQQKMPHFCLFLTTNIIDADFYRGYLLTGMVERGNRKLGIWESTHYAYVKREGY
ncbi:unnamed protein product [Schistosoma curassoni]|uniref:Lipocalin-like domain-containing protein n=1 Tax=Schistosoma curassoni TaxID=6186 RepID=A0A183K1B5_9TREM|nr:unnamed protein product [Schistosoma curassoni]